jgi:hypothetical protein
MLELGEVGSLRVGLGQFALMELGELGSTIYIHGLPSIKYHLHSSTFLVA